ncbi:MAG: hypothetical protein IEMM0008_1079 [bacterium]|nr:MAG: hypothetical protein IEMM0008_1079 [bacterium]
MKCLFCQDEMEKEKVPYSVDRKGYHLYIHEIPAYVCSQCGEKHFAEEEVEQIQGMIRTLEQNLEKLQTV